MIALMYPPAMAASITQVMAGTATASTIAVVEEAVTYGEIIVIRSDVTSINIC